MKLSTGITVAVLVLAGAVGVAYLRWTTSGGGRTPAGITLSDLRRVTASVDSIPVAKCPEPAATQRCQLVAEVDRLRKSHEIGSFLWSFSYHLCLFGAIILTGAAGVLAKLDVTPEIDTTEIAAMSAADAEAAMKVRESVAAVKAKKKTDTRRTTAAWFAFIAALLTSITAAGGFSGKWKANRDARARLDTVRIDLQDPTVTLSQIRDSLRVIIRDENGAINAAGPK